MRENKKKPQVPLTLEDVASASPGESFKFLFGWPGCALAVAGLVGGLLVERQWSGQVNGVLSAAMTPVAVLAASATLVFSGAVGSAFRDSRGDRSPFAVQVGLSVLYVGLTVAYFVFALTALSIPPGKLGRLPVVGIAYMFLGAVLGASLVMLWRLLALEREGHGEANEEGNEEGAVSEG